MKIAGRILRKSPRSKVWIYVEARRGSSIVSRHAEVAPHEDAIEPLLDRPMGLDESQAAVERQIFCHRRIGVEPHGEEISPPRLALRMVHQLPPEAAALPGRIDRDVVDVIGIRLLPGDH